MPQRTRAHGPDGWSGRVGSGRSDQPGLLESGGSGGSGESVGLPGRV